MFAYGTMQSNAFAFPVVLVPVTGYVVSNRSACDIAYGKVRTIARECATIVKGVSYLIALAIDPTCM